MAAPTVALGSAQGRWVVTVAVLGAALTFIDATVVAIALPRIVEDLDADVASAVWVVTGYNLALAALVLTAGALGDRFGLRATYVVGVGGFTLASLACGAAPSTELLVGARVAQGVFAALLTPASLALVQESLRREDRGRGVGVWSGLTGVAGAAGPVLGGLLVEHADWRWAFLVNLPLGVFVVWAVLRHLPAVAGERRTTGPVDWVGAALLTAALAALTSALMRSGDASVLDAALWGAAVVLGVVLVVHLRRAPAPLVPAALWRDRAFRGVTVATFLFYGALALAFFMLPLVLQVGAGLTPLVAGSAQLPVTVLMLLFSGRVGGVMERTGAAPPMVGGALLAAASLAWLTRLDEQAGLVRDVLPPATLLGVGLTLFVTPLTATALAAAPSDMVGLASGVNNAVARTGGLLAVALVPLVGGLAGDALSSPAAVVGAAGTVFTAGAALMVATAVVVAVTVPWRPARPVADEPPPAERVPSAHCSPSCPPAVAADDVRR